MIFVDTSAWYAASVHDDADHVPAREFLASFRDELITSDFVLDETLTLLRARRHDLLAQTLGASLFGADIQMVHFLSEAELLDAWAVFQKFSDKEWSFTDCTSKVVMERLGIKTAFTFDHHFKQFGDIEIVPAQS
ncbi:MAG TPA: type II toxin-antitoxin system VapC family toxin [Planctomycetota bacterium]|nr:type II toxin-antitoxin system VapC family toxin [Planctomycetota bacterium]